MSPEYQRNLLAVKNVIIVSDFAYIAGGAEKVAIETAVEFSKVFPNVFFFSGTGPVCAELQDSAVEVSCLEVEPYLDRPNVFSAAIQGLHDAFTKKSFIREYSSLEASETVVHVHGFFHSLSTSVFLAAQACGFRCVLSLHEYSSVCGNMGLYDFRRQRTCEKEPCSLLCTLHDCDKRSYLQKLYRNIRTFYFRYVLRKTTPRAIFVSDYSRSVLQGKKAFLRLGLNSCTIVDPVSVEPARTVSSHSDSDYYLFVGRVVPEKGARLFCEAVEQSGTRGVVVGVGSELKELQNSYRSVSFLGYQEAENVRELMAGARALVFPSTWHETFGLVVLEAMIGASLPCVVANKCASADFVQDGKTGILFESGSIDSLIEALVKLRDNDLVTKLTAGAFSWKEGTQFGIERHVKELVSFYEEAMREGASTGYRGK